MPIVPQVKCRRCGATFSSLSSRCPNCGTRRVSQSSRTPGTTPSTVKGTAAYDRATANTKWQMIFGLILVVAVILAVIIMVSTGIDGSGSSAKPPRATVEVSTEPVVETPVVTPTQMPTVESVIITYYGTPKDDVTMEVGTEPLAFTASVTPRDLQDVAANTVCLRVMKLLLRFPGLTTADVRLPRSDPELRHSHARFSAYPPSAYSAPGANKSEICFRPLKGRIFYLNICCLVGSF